MNSQSLCAFWRTSTFVFMALLVSSCGILTPRPGTVVQQTDVRQYTKNGISVSVFTSLVQTKRKYFTDEVVKCRLDSADFSTYESILVDIDHPQYLYIREEFGPSDLNRWKTCRSWETRNYEGFRIRSYSGLGRILPVGCTSNPGGLRLANGDLVIGTTCGKWVTDGARIASDGRISLCRTVDTEEPVLGSSASDGNRTRCVETDASGNPRRFIHYNRGSEYDRQDSDWKGAQLDGPQLKYTENGALQYSYYESGEKIASYEGQVKSKADPKWRHRKERDQLAQEHDSAIEPVARTLRNLRSGDSALSRVRNMYSDGEPVKYCGCVWASCLTMERYNEPKLSAAEKAAVDKRSKARRAMCIALRRSGLIEVSGAGTVSLAKGADALTVEGALATGDFSSIDVGGENGDLLREAQQQFHAADRLDHEASALREAKAQAMASLEAKQKREKIEAEKLAVEKERRRVADIAVQERRVLDEYKSCMESNGMDWDRRAEWEVVPAGC